MLLVPSLQIAPARPFGQPAGLVELDDDDDDDEDGGGEPTTSSEPAQDTNDKVMIKIIVKIDFIELPSVLPAITSAILSLPAALLTLLRSSLALSRSSFFC